VNRDSSGIEHPLLCSHQGVYREEGAGGTFSDIPTATRHRGWVLKPKFSPRTVIAEIEIALEGRRRRRSLVSSNYRTATFQQPFVRSSVFRLLRFPMKRERKLDGRRRNKSGRGRSRMEIGKLAPIIAGRSSNGPSVRPSAMNGDLKVPSYLL